MKFIGEISHEEELRDFVTSCLSVLVLKNTVGYHPPCYGAEYYLDPESLAMTGAVLARNLIKYAG